MTVSNMERFVSEIEEMFLGFLGVWVFGFEY